MHRKPSPGRTAAHAARAVARVRDTQPRPDVPHDARAANVHGATGCTGGVAGMPSAFADDVMTRGASLEDPVRTLGRAGAARVGAWGVVRTWLR